MSGQKVVISPLVLLSVVDHYKRLSSPRVVGILLGTKSDRAIEVTNSFAIPFEEYDEGFFIDTSYLLKMYDLYSKVNSFEQIVGWYHSGPKLHHSDLEISKTMLKYCARPVLAVVNLHLNTSDIPCKAFQLVNCQELAHINVQIGADETEEVGVEHLLRDIKEGTGCNIKEKVGIIIGSLEAYRDALSEIIAYLERVEKGMKPNREILEKFQDILNDAPRITTEVDMNALYVTELASSLIAANDLKIKEMDNK